MGLSQELYSPGQAVTLYMITFGVANLDDDYGRKILVGTRQSSGHWR